jgi:hypothetical protein
MDTTKSKSFMWISTMKKHNKILIGQFYINFNMDCQSPSKLNMDFYFIMCFYNVFETLEHNILKVDNT